MTRSRGWVAFVAVSVSTAAVGPFACSSGEVASDARDASPDDTDSRLGVGADLDATDRCLGCHRKVADDWEHPSTHRQLLDCVACHTVSDAPPGPGHADRPECSTCHSQLEHSEQGCTTCHSQHGSPNAYLIRSVLALPDGGTAHIHFTRPEGASEDGLARAGVDGEMAGTGLCEVCHTSERKYYNREGAGAPHDATWCATCHVHSAGFIAPGPAATD